MAIVKPFTALRPDPILAARVCELPYDVMSSAEARAVAANNPLSFLHVSKPEIDLEPDIHPYDPRVYAQGRTSFFKLIGDAVLQRDVQPAFYLYRQVMGQHTQLGLVALTSCQAYLANEIRKHELTRPEKEDDRVRHMESLNAQTGPAFLTYPAQSALDEALRRRIDAVPEVDFNAADGVRHSSWRVGDRAEVDFIQRAFAAIPSLYIADGHHRTAAAARVHQQRADSVSAAYFLSVIFPHNQVQILPYNRVLKDLRGHTAAKVLQWLESVFVVKRNGVAKPMRRHELGLYLNGEWITLTFKPHSTATQDPLEQLDVTLLQKHVLTPLFGIEDPRWSERIEFVGGIRGPAELERLVQSGQAACAFSLFPTSISELMAIADAGQLMPPKSTWFEPKLRDGMFCHLLEDRSAC